MPDWVAKANIDHFKKLLEAERDPQKRAMIELGREQAKTKAAALKQQGERKKD